MTQTPDLVPIQNLEDQLDRLVDTRGYSYDEARRELGLPEPEAYAAPQIPEHRPASDNPKNWQTGEWRNLSARQNDINRAGAQLVRATLVAGKKRSE